MSIEVDGTYACEKGYELEAEINITDCNRTITLEFCCANYGNDNWRVKPEDRLKKLDTLIDGLNTFKTEYIKRLEHAKAQHLEIKAKNDSKTS